MLSGKDQMEDERYDGPEKDGKDAIREDPEKM